MAEYSQPAAVTKRVRFFDGQFLVDQDFVDEQKYHLDRERRLGKVLRVTGVADGLAVSSGQANKVTVRAGTAIDADGRHLVLAEDRTVDLPAATFNGQQGVRFLMVYRQTETDMATTEGGMGERRWLEDPLVAAVTSGGQSSTTETWSDTLPTVVLSLLALDDQGRVTVDANAAQRAGMRLPGALGVGTTDLGSNRLSVNGPSRLGGVTDYRSTTVLSVAPGTVQFDAPNVAGGRLTIDGATGNVGVGTPGPAARLDVAGQGDRAGQVSLQLRSGNSATSYSSNQLTFGWAGSAQYRHAVRTRHNAGAAAGNAYDFYVWKAGTDGVDTIGSQHVMSLDGGNVGIGTTTPGDYRLSVSGPSRMGPVSADYREATVLSVAPGTVLFDGPNVAGGRLTIDGVTGNVGIGTRTPRSALDTAKGVMTGAANDYQKAQLTMSGGGTVNWAYTPHTGRLKWSQRFIAISMERGQTFAEGHVNIDQPTAPIPAGNVYDGRARTADANGVVLNAWDALYAVHDVGGNQTAVSSFQVRNYTQGFNAPSNWILVAVVNADNWTVKLGTGLTLAANSQSAHGSPVPSGTIVMWSGNAGNIPGGWTLCDGGNGTPNLRSRFVMGADTGLPDQAPGRFGDPDNHNHRISISGGQLVTGPAGDHNHAFPTGWYDIKLEASRLTGSTVIDRNGQAIDNDRTSISGGHTHSLSTLGSFDSTQSAGNRPRWYALCFIMKL